MTFFRAELTVYAAEPGDKYEHETRLCAVVLTGGSQAQVLDQLLPHAAALAASAREAVGESVDSAKWSSGQGS